METFKKFIEQYTVLPLQEWNIIAQSLQYRRLEKDEILLEAGKICRHLYFVEQGLLRYFILKNGNDISKFFTEAPYCFTSQVSFTSEQPANESIEALEPCEIWQMTLRQANDLLRLQSWNTFIRRLVQEVQSFTEEILEQIQTETAEQRYEKMLTEYPTLVQRVPLKHIASYLGIAPQSLSRIRKKIAARART